ncbi:hypothetical protein [Microvirga yunnanensis]|uniref:hypothetical protein n=1 Tax=Microvirga yunnanensis TaxID=2953740 RepID=UPI0021C58C8C|nr:hypothetical protein [Microvirga sp. HBU65207]
MSNLVQLSSHPAIQVTDDAASVLEVTQRLNALVRELSDIAHQIIASGAPEPLKHKIVQNLVGMQQHAYCISQDIISQCRPEKSHLPKRVAVSP